MTPTRRQPANEIIFEDPPPAPVNEPGKVAKLLDPLREHPGKWARIYQAKNASMAALWASQVRTGKPVGVEAGEFETRRGQAEGYWFVWARYVGEEIR